MNATLNIHHVTDVSVKKPEKLECRSRTAFVQEITITSTSGELTIDLFLEDKKEESDDE